MQYIAPPNFHVPSFSLYSRSAFLHMFIFMFFLLLRFLVPIFDRFFHVIRWNEELSIKMRQHRPISREKNSSNARKYVTNKWHRDTPDSLTRSKYKHTSAFTPYVALTLFLSLSLSPKRGSQFKYCSKILWSGIKYKIQLCISKIINAIVCDKYDKQKFIRMHLKCFIQYKAVYDEHRHH